MSELTTHGRGDSHYNHQGKVVAKSVLLTAVCLTLGYAVIEIIGGLWANSLALLSDAGHMVTDSAALAFALIANLLSRRPASPKFSFGLAKVEVIAAFVNALAMLAVVAWIFKEAIERLVTPQVVHGGPVFLVAGAGLLINIVVAWTLSHDHKNVNTKAALIHVMGDLLGSVAAIVAGVVIYCGGSPMVDPLLSMLVCLLILRSTFAVLKSTTKTLLDAVPSGVDYTKVGEVLSSIPGVKAVHDLHVWTMSPGHDAVQAHVLLENLSIWPQVLDQARAKMNQEFHIDHVTLQPEDHQARH